MIIYAPIPELPADGRTILVVGQVEDDASMQYGATEINSNLGLLQRTRAHCPDARILWKPHPDVEAGLRSGIIEESDLKGLADISLVNVGADQAIDLADEVWTISSTLGFEALIRSKPVTCLGMPFYAGRGLTNDLVARPSHRNTDVTLEQLVHACLIAYPRYFDPRTGAPLSPENAVRLLAEGFEMPPVNRWMVKLLALMQPFRR